MAMTEWHNYVEKRMFPDIQKAEQRKERLKIEEQLHREEEALRQAATEGGTGTTSRERILVVEEKDMSDTVIERISRLINFRRDKD